MTSTPLRRSGRSRQKASNYYEDEKKRIEEEELLKSNEKSTQSGTDESDNEDGEEVEDNDTEMDSVAEEEDDDDVDGSTSDEEYQAKKTRPSSTPKRKTPSRSPAKSTSKPIILKSPLATRFKKNAFTRTTTTTASAFSSTPKTIQNALQLVSRKIFTLDPKNKKGNERLKNSLFASLMQSYKPPSINSKNKSSSTPSRSYHDDDLYYTQPVTKYTHQLTQIAYELVDEFNTTNNPTSMHLQLLNLLFVSIGGTSKSMLLDGKQQRTDDQENSNDDDSDNGRNDDVDDVSGGGQVVDDLEDLDADDWNKIITNLVNDMRNTPLEYIPFCCDPNGALHWTAMQTLNQHKTPPITTVTPDSNDDDEDYHRNKFSKQQQISERDVVVKKGNSSLILGVREYRSIFEEFWYVLGTVALVEGGMSNSNNNRPKNEDDEEEDDDDNTAVTSDEEDHDNSSTGGKRKRKRKTSSLTNKNKKPRKKPKQEKDNSISTSMTRFDSEIVVSILSRINELVSAGQPDVRAVATTAALFLLHAIVDRTAFVQERLDVTKRQYDAANKSGKASRSNATVGPKAKSLKHQIDSLERTLDDLEHVIETFFINAIFMHRYRDSNMYIRSSCLQALGRMTIIRPDFFLKDKFMKYLGWMMSDKAECVRVAALTGLYRPFQVKDSGQQNKITDKIDLMVMERVVTKFLERVVDSVIDIHESVQEIGMKFMLSLMRNGFLEELDDKQEDEKDLMSDEMWDQVNLMALATDTSPMVRRDALYFIMEQLEDFDEGDDDEDMIEDADDSSAHTAKEAKKVTNVSSNISDRTLAQRLDAIASWAAHTLTAGKIPIEKIRIRLVDHLVHSLRAMPEHKSIVTNWPAMIRAITEDNIAMTSQGTSAGERADVAKQRVLVQMLICAAMAEVESVDTEFLYRDVDLDVVDVMKRKPMIGRDHAANQKKKIKKASTNLQHESLSISLIKALPNLLVQFKSDSTIVDSLVSLPRYFIPSIFNLSQRKSAFVSMTKNLSDIFLQSNDEKVLVNCALSLSSLCKGDHARVVEARTVLKKTVTEIRDRILAHISVKETDEGDKSERSSSRHAKSSSDGLEDDSQDNLDSESSSVLDNHYALYYNLKRIGVLAKRVDISEYIGKNENNEDYLEEFCNFVSDGLAHRLTTFKSKVINTDDQGGEVWERDDKKRLLEITALLIHEGLHFLLCTTAWKVKAMLELNQLVVDESDLLKSSEEKADKEEDVDHVAIRLRNRLIILVELCFEQHLPESEDDYSDAQHEWSDSIQEIGGLISSDLRSLFIQEWSNASSPLLRAAAITEDSRLIAGYIRYFCAKESEISSDEENARSLLLPLVRGLVSNWKLGNRREASYALSHITGSGAVATEIVDTFSRLLKKIEPVRLLEAHMASLRLSYEKWLNNDPEEMMGDNLTQGTDDITMNAFQELETQHKEQFKNLLNQAQRFSTSLGVRKLSDKRLSPGLLGFMIEGIRYSFSDVDDMLLGCRLSFLSILSKYTQWIKKNKTHLWEVAQYLHTQEAELKEQELAEEESKGEDFEGIHEDDLQALADFRSSLGLKVSTIFSPDTVDSKLGFETRTPDSSRLQKSQVSSDLSPDESRDVVSDMSSLSLPSSSRAQRSRSSTGSALSKISSTRGSLSPLYEAVEGEDDESPNNDTTTHDSITSKSTGLKSQHLTKDTSSPHDDHSRSTVSTIRTGRKSELPSPRTDDLPSSPVSQNYEKTQSTFDGEQSDVDSEFLETPN